MVKTKICEYCGKGFEDKHNDGKRFCNRSCALYCRARTTKNPIAGKVGDQNPNWKGGNIKKCEQCGVEFIDRHYDGKRFCSKSCSATHNNSLRPTKIKPEKIVRSVKVKQIKITRPPKTKFPKLIKEPKAERKLKICPTCGNEFCTRNKKAIYCNRTCYRNSPGFIELQGARNRGKSAPEHARQAISKAHSSRSAETRYTWGKSGFYDSEKAGKIFYRSSYELRAFQMLDENSSVSLYRAEPFVISYLDHDGSTRRYRPDVLISCDDGSKILVEIKPKWKLSDDKVKLKLDAGKQYAIQKGWRFEVWTEKELGLK